MQRTTVAKIIQVLMFNFAQIFEVTKYDYTSLICGNYMSLHCPPYSTCCIEAIAIYYVFYLIF